MSKKTSTQTENKPPAWAEPLFKLGADEAMNLFNSGSGGNTYMGSTVADLSGMTLGGINDLAAAGKAWDTSGTRPQFAQIRSASMNDPFVSGLSNLSNSIEAERVGAQNVRTEGEYRDIYNRAQAPSAAEQYLTGYASGDNLKNGGNPYYRERLEGDLADTAARVQSSFSGAGRYGSGANTNVLSNEIGQMRLGALENDWNREQANQFAATGMIDQGRQAGFANQLAAVTGMTGVQTGNADRRFAADTGNADRALSAQGLRGNLLSQAGALRGQGLDRSLSATGAMSELDQRNFTNRLTGAQATINAGGMLDKQAQAKLSDEIAKWYAEDNKDWNRLSMLLGAAQGSAGNYGMQNSVSRQPLNFMGPLGALIGKSDIRLKEDIVPVGAVYGFPVYTFKYKDRPGRWLGVMAQEVALIDPLAVMMEDDGYLAVDYGRLGFPMMRIH